MADLLPPNSTPLERNIAAVNARLGDIPVQLRYLVNPHTCPAKFLPWLAVELAVFPWSDQWTEAQQRRVIASAYQVHRQRGTLAALKAALAALDVSVGVVEWWQEEPRGIPGTFRLDVELADHGLIEQELAFLDSQVDSVKPLRAHYTIRLVANTSAGVRYGFATMSGEVTEVLPYNITSIEASPVLSAHAIGYQDWMTTTIYPKEI